MSTLVFTIIFLAIILFSGIIARISKAFGRFGFSVIGLFLVSYHTYAALVTGYIGFNFMLVGKSFDGFWPIVAFLIGSLMILISTLMIKEKVLR